MKGFFITILLTAVLFGAVFVHFEKKKGDYGAELDQARSGYKAVLKKQARITSHKLKRADYFKKIFILNRPFSLSSSVSELLSTAYRLLPGVGLTRISLERVTGNIEFTFEGRIDPDHREKHLLMLKKFVAGLEDAGAFILSNTYPGPGEHGFSISGEVSSE